jgi:hypothetical protein
MSTPPMKPMTVRLRPKQIEPLRWLAKRRQISTAELIRQGVDRVLADAPAEKDPLWSIIGICDSGVEDLAEKHDEYIAKMIHAESRR